MTDLHQPSRSPAELFGDTQPQWFNPSSFLHAALDPDAYIADLRSYVPLDALRSHLRTHLAALHRHLVDLINRDYADFVSLTTKLVDVDAAVARMRPPLLELRDKIAAFRAAVDASLAALNHGLRQRASAAAVREALELLLDIFHVVSKIEKLIKELPYVPTDSSLENGTFDGKALRNKESLVQLDGIVLRKTQSMLLERIASEMNRLKFYIAHGENLPFVVNMEPRIKTASSVLRQSLHQCLVASLEHRDMGAISNCLRAYAAIDDTAGAEEIFRETVVSPTVQKIISGNSPVVSVGNSVDELENDYEQIMQFVERDCRFVLEISSSANSGLHVFDFLGNSILKEVFLAIQKRKPGALSPGKPSLFLKNFKSSLMFLAYLEGYCPSRSAVSKFRSEAACNDFMKQWNVGVYFSLRFQEIAGTLDSALMTSNLSRAPLLQPSNDKSVELTFKQSVALLDSLKSCWKDDVLLLSHTDKFLRLALQLLSRYTMWLSSGFAARKEGTTVASSSLEWAISASPEDFVYVLHDIHCLTSEINSNYINHVLGVLASCPDKVQEMVRLSIVQGVKLLKNVTPIITDAIVNGLVEKSVEELRHLKGVVSTYRMTNKPMPVRHSPYVSNILRPLKEFLDGKHALYLINETRDELLLGTVQRITSRFHELAVETVNVARKTDASLQKLRHSAQKKAGASTDQLDHNQSADKICAQLFLDLVEYGQNLRAIGVNAVDVPPYRSLWEYLAPPDRQAAIVF